LEFMKDHGLITGTAKQWKFKLPSGEHELSTKEFVEKVNADAIFKDEVYTMICDNQIMKYRDPNSKIEEDVVVDDEVADDD